MQANLQLAWGVRIPPTYESLADIKHQKRTWFALRILVGRYQVYTLLLPNLKQYLC